MKIGIVTCAVLPEPDPDQELILAEFDRQGHDACLVPWDRASIDHGEFDVCIVRSPWNYPENPTRFMEWIRDANSKSILLNPYEIIAGNIAKTYLAELETNGFEIVPTRFFSGTNFPTGLHWNKLVVKPSIGAGSMDTRVFSKEDFSEILPWLASFPGDRGWLAQPYLESIHTALEQSIIVIDGIPTHRMTKRPRFQGQDERVEGPYPIPHELREIAKHVLASFGHLLYARIDLMQSDNGRWLISEVELIEPSLFFKQYPPALELFVEATPKYVERVSGR